MKTGLKYLIFITMSLLFAGLLVISGEMARKERAKKTCSGLVVEIADSSKLHFVTAKDVRSYIKEDYGTFSGKRLDSVGLRKIEESLVRHSAILSAQAWTVTDGKVHVSVTQREPVARFMTAEGGFYSDEKGYLFPLQNHYTSRVPIIDGNVPLSLSRCKNGIPVSEKERRWLEGVIELISYIGNDKVWKDAIVQISVDSDGDLVMVPRKGRELFIFGTPQDYEEKFARIKDYYSAVAPSAAADSIKYRYVTVKYRGQIICR